MGFSGLSLVHSGGILWESFIDTSSPSIMKTRKHDLTNCWCLGLSLPTSRTLQNKILLLINYPACDFIIYLFIYLLFFFFRKDIIKTRLAPNLLCGQGQPWVFDLPTSTFPSPSGITSECPVLRIDPRVLCMLVKLSIGWTTSLPLSFWYFVIAAWMDWDIIINRRIDWFVHVYIVS